MDERYSKTSSATAFLAEITSSSEYARLQQRYNDLKGSLATVAHEAYAKASDCSLSQGLVQPAVPVSYIPLTLPTIHTV